MRSNQVSILIERFGEYVPKDYPAYAMAVNELNEYESIGASANVSTNEFSYVDYRKMHGTIPKSRRSYDEDIDLEYGDTRLPLLKDYAWVYEHSGEIMEVIKSSGKEDVVPALRERFALDDVQVRKLLQLRMDMLDRDSYEKICREIENLERKRKENREKAPEEMNGMKKIEHLISWRNKIRECKQEIDVIKAYFTAADHYEDIIRVLRGAEEDGYMQYMKKTYGSSPEQARAVKYAPAEYYSRQGRSRQEEKLKRLEEDLAFYQKWLEEAEKATAAGEQ